MFYTHTAWPDCCVDNEPTGARFGPCKPREIKITLPAHTMAL